MPSPLHITSVALLAVVSLFFSGCVTHDDRSVMYVSVAQQRLHLYQDEVPVVSYPISTSKFGIGDTPNSYKTPEGLMRVKSKIGDTLPSGAVLKSRVPTGEILPPDSPGRDPIVSRILWLEGREPQNANAFERYIYIHGTTEEKTIGEASSYGCIRMKSQDVIDLFDRVGTGARVYVMDDTKETPGASE